MTYFFLYHNIYYIVKVQGTGGKNTRYMYLIDVNVQCKTGIPFIVSLLPDFIAQWGTRNKTSIFITFKLAKMVSYILVCWLAENS